VEVGRTEPALLRIEIAEQPALEEWIIAKIDAGHDVCWAICDLFRFGKKIVGPAIEHHSPNEPDGQHLLGNDLGGVENVIGKLGRKCFIKGLNTEFPLRIVAARYRVEKITPMEIWIGPSNFDGLTPNRGLTALFGLPTTNGTARLGCLNASRNFTFTASSFRFRTALKFLPPY